MILVKLWSQSNRHRYTVRMTLQNCVNGTFDGNWESKHMQAVNLEQVENVILTEKLNIFKEFELRCKLQLVKDLLYRNVISDHIDPLLKRIDSRIEDFQKYIEIVGQIDNVKFLEIISLRDLNQEAKQIVAMLTSKMFSMSEDE